MSILNKQPSKMKITASVTQTNMSDAKTAAIHSFINKAIKEKRNPRWMQKEVFLRFNAKISFTIPPVEVVKQQNHGDSK